MMVHIRRNDPLGEPILPIASLRVRPSLVLEGEHDTRPVVMFEFPSMEAIHAFWNSPDYVPIKKLRDGIATLNVWAFPGA